MKAVIALYDSILYGLGMLPGVLVAVIGFGTCADVLLRDFGYSGLYGVLDITEYSLLIMTMAGIGYIMRIGRHITVDILVENLPWHSARVLNITATLIATLASIAFFYFGVATTIDSYHSAALVMKALVFPEWPLIALVPFGFAFLIIELLRRLWLMIVSENNLNSAGTGRDGGV